MKQLVPVLLVPLLAVPLAGCGPAHFLGNAEIPSAKNLAAVMWSQAELADPAFKKIAAPAYSDADWAAFTAVGKRLQITSVKIKQDFSKGADWNALADSLGTHAGELIAAAEAQDGKAAATALAATRTSCFICHQRFK